MRKFLVSPILYKKDTGQQFLQKNAVQQAVPLNWQARSRYCRWFQESTASWFLDRSLRFCSHEAWFTLNGKAKSHTNGHWCSSHAGHDFPLRNLRLRCPTLIHVRGTVRTRSTVGPVFFEEPTSPYRYVLLILISFIRQLRLAGSPDFNPWEYYLWWREDNITMDLQEVRCGGYGLDRAGSG